MKTLLSKEQAVENAIEYGKSQNLESFHLDYVTLDGVRPDPKWRVYLRFNNCSLDLVGVPEGVVVIVDASTGEPSINFSL